MLHLLKVVVLAVSIERCGDAVEMGGFYSKNIPRG
jgi:hypothetical protein